MARRWVFIHVPKTGGTSLRGVLGPDRMHNPEYAPVLEGGHRPLPIHLWARHIRKGAGEETWEQVFSFACVRNPWDRLVSLYRFRKRRNQVPQQREFLPWLEGLDQVHDGGLTPQWDRLSCPDSGRLIVDCVLRYETLGRDFRALCGQLGIPPRPLPHQNAAGKPVDYREFYDDAARERVAALFGREIAFFNYTFNEEAA